MKVLIVDDEPLARSRLKRLLAEHKNITVVGEAENTSDALSKAKELEPDLVFLDIEMPGENGLVAANLLNRQQVPPAIVFVTAHPEHALDAYTVSPSDYLLKPVDPKRLSSTINRIGLYTRAHIDKIEEANPWFSYQVGNHLRRIRFDQIQCFIAEDKLVKMLSDEGEAIIDCTLKQLEERFPYLLLRIHRSTLVNVSRAVEIKRCANSQHTLCMSNSNIKLEVSRRHLNQVKKTLGIS